MTKKKGWKILWALCALNFALHLVFYPRLPEIIPVHWDGHGYVNGEGPRYLALLFAALPAAVLLLMTVLPKVDPRHANYSKFGKIYEGFAAAITILMMLVSWMTELYVFGIMKEGSSLVGLLVSVPIGILFIVMGNYMPRVRQNYFFGIKTPWALNDEYNWQKTHRMGGIVFIIMGIILIAAGIFSSAISEKALLALILVPVFGGSAWLYLYSYLVYRKQTK